jgi:hypothetical protein
MNIFGFCWLKTFHPHFFTFLHFGLGWDDSDDFFLYREGCLAVVRHILGKLILMNPSPAQLNKERHKLVAPHNVLANKAESGKEDKQKAKNMTNHLKFMNILYIQRTHHSLIR